MGYLQKARSRHGLRERSFHASTPRARLSRRNAVQSLDGPGKRPAAAFPRQRKRRQGQAKSPLRWVCMVPVRSEMPPRRKTERSEEHTSELQSLMRISYAVFCLKKKKQITSKHNNTITQ